MASRVFSDTLANLSSERLKDRAQGLEDVRLFLSVPRNLEWLNGDKKQWLKFVQAIFQIVVDEQKAYVKKPTTPALKRLRDAAQAVRLVIEKAAADLPRKAFKAVFNHILSVIVVRQQLFEPVALEYLKALAAVLAYRPHLENLEDTQWNHAVSLCFSAVLGDPIRGYDIIDQSLLEHEEDELSSAESDAPKAKKRRITASSRASSSAIFDNGGTSQRPAGRLAGQDTIELCSCLGTLFGTPRAPVLDNADALAFKFVRFFRAYPMETSAHLPIIVAFNRLLEDLEYNRKTLMERLVPRALPEIEALWSTKSIAVKEQLVIALARLIPYASAAPSDSAQNMLSGTYNVLLSDLESRWATDVLDISSLCLSHGATYEVDDDADDADREARAFRLGTISAGTTFDLTQALAWSTLRLSAICFTRLSALHEAGNCDQPTPSRVSKRAKTEDPMFSLSEDLAGSQAKTIVHRLQLLLFTLQDGNASPEVTLLRQAQPTLLRLLNNSDHSVQMWAMILLANVAQSTSHQLPLAAGQIQFWQNVWDVTIKKHHHRDVSRTACHLLVILSYSALVEASKVSTDMTAVGRELEVQGPPSPNDAACALLKRILDFAQSDVRAYRDNILDKISHRLTSHWNLLPPSAKMPLSFSGHKARNEPLCVSSMLELLFAVSYSGSRSPLSSLTTTSILPDCAIVTFELSQANTKSQRDWFWNAQLPDIVPHDLKLKLKLEAQQPSCTMVRSRDVTVRIIICLKRAVETVLAEVDYADEVFWTTLPLDRFRRILEVLVVGILFDASATLARVVRVDSCLPAAFKALDICVPRILQNNWTLQERAFLMAALSPILLAFRHSHGKTRSQTLLYATSTSGVSQAFLQSTAARERTSSSQAENELLQCIWGSEGFRDTMCKHEELFARLLRLQTDSEEALIVDAEFGQVRNTSTQQIASQAILQSSSSMAAKVCLSTAMRLLVTIAYFGQTDRKPVRLRRVVQNILDGSGMQMIAVGPHLLDAMDSVLLTLGSRETERLIEKIGADLLPSYEYARSSDLHLLVMRYLLVTSSEWGVRARLESAHVDNARRLAAWYTGQLITKGAQAWRFRTDCIELVGSFLGTQLDPLAFGHEAEISACHEGVPIPPEEVIIRQLCDSDYRVRFKLAPYLGKACAYLQEQSPDTYAVWERVDKSRKLSIEEDDLEGNMTMLLSYANVMIASDLFRASAYSPIINFAALNKHQSTSLYIRATLQATAVRLGLANVSQLYTFLAPYTMAEHISTGRERLTIPDPTAFGFENRQALYAAGFDETAPMILASSRTTFFPDLCGHVGINEEIATLRVFPTYVAFKLSAAEVGSAIYRAAEQEIAIKAVHLATQNNLRAPEYLRRIGDLVVWRLFSFVWEPVYSLTALIPVLRKNWTETETVTSHLKILMNLSGRPFRPNNLSPPVVRLHTVLQIMTEKHPSVAEAMSDEAIVYNVLHRLLRDAGEAVFVSHSLRLLHNTVLFVACASATITKSSSVLELLLHRTSRLMVNTDLFCLCSTIFKWAFDCSSQIIVKDHSLQFDSLQSVTRAVHQAYQSLDTHGTAVSGAADELVKSIRLSCQKLENCGRKDIEHSLICLDMLTKRDARSWPETLEVDTFGEALHLSPTIYSTIHCMRQLNSVLRERSAPMPTEKLPSMLWYCLDQMRRSKLSEAELVDGARAFAELLDLARAEIAPVDIKNLRKPQGREKQGSLESCKAEIMRYVCALLDDESTTTIGLAYEGIQDVLALTGLQAWGPGRQMDLIGATHLARLPGSLVYARKEDLQELNAVARGNVSNVCWQQELSIVLAGRMGHADGFFAILQTLFKRSTDLVSNCLPSLLVAYLMDTRATNSQGLDRRSELSEYLTLLLGQNDTPAKEAVDIILQLRQYHLSGDGANPSSPLARDAWLDVSYFQLASVAAANQSPYAALLCAELAVEHNNVDPHTLQDVMIKIYSMIDEPDGFYSITFSNTSQGVLQRLRHENRWSDALAWQGANLEVNPLQEESLLGVLESISSNDLDNLAMHLFRSRDDASLMPKDLLYSMAWKSQTWDLPTEQGHVTDTKIFLYKALRDACGVTTQTQSTATSAALAFTLQSLTSSICESPALQAQYLMDILVLREIELFPRESAEGLEHHVGCKTPWQLYPYSTAECILKARSVLLAGLAAADEHIRIDETSTLTLKIRNAEKVTFLTLGALALRKKFYQVALNAALKSQDRHVADKSDFETTIILSDVCWQKGETKAAIDCLRHAMIEASSTYSDAEKAQILSQLGTWSSTARLEDAATIRDRYFELAWAAVAKSACEQNVRASVAAKYARFADEQYQETSLQVTAIEQLDTYSRKKEVELRELIKQSKASQSPSSEILSRQRVASVIAKQDRQVVAEFRASRRALLESAIAMYGHSLSTTLEVDDRVYRLTSLWLESAVDDQMCTVADKHIHAVSSHHFVELVPQLSARLASLNEGDKTPFRHTLEKLVSRLCTDHPFHSLYQIFFLEGNKLSRSSQSTSQRRKSNGSGSVHKNGQTGIIGTLLQKLRKHPASDVIVRQVGTAIDAFSEWAVTHIDKPKASESKIRAIPSDRKLLKLKNLDIPVATLKLQVDQSCKYTTSSFPCIKGYTKTYTTAGGINLPKITDCLGSDGLTYRQLFKGGDDVRQDAVMQQIFGVTNSLLLGDDQAQARQLVIKTYKVIPLTSDSGLLQFVANSQAIGEWLLSAHQRYNKDDMAVLDARKRMAEVQKAPPSERVVVYKQIMQRMHPVMRHFFTERHHQPYYWFRLRLNYSRSTAVMSMIGHVMGIGDRHVSNIMIDTVTGELVPIDFGIAFEGGKQLPTPELVPFRLTPDITDGFGFTGVEGVFRKCSEETMRILRTKSSVLMTILEVFKYDPLQKWTATASKVHRMQGSQALERTDESSKGDELTDAARAIRTVSEKLQPTLSVEYTVNHLISQARDPSNLGAIYYGWQPYL